jgi:phosphoenolpyruvate carboxykinase (GTP)
LRYKNLSKYFFDPYGLKIDAILFGSRRKELIPLVFETFSWEEGVLFGAMLRSETTAAAIESYKQLKNDPMAMRPFCGYNMAKYFLHWIKFGKKLKEKPRIFVVNWFRRDEKGNFIWPGFNKNMYVINWIVERIKGKAAAIKTPIGFVPDYNKFDFGIEKERLEKLFKIDKEGWLKELNDAKEFFSIFPNFPKDLSKTLSEVERRVKS